MALKAAFLTGTDTETADKLYVVGSFSLEDALANVCRYYGGKCRIDLGSNHKNIRCSHCEKKMEKTRLHERKDGPDPFCILEGIRRK